MNVHTILILIFGGIAAGGAFACCSARLLAVLQQEGYAGGAFLKWYYRPSNIEHKKASILILALALTTALFSVCFSFLGHVLACAVSAAPFAALCVFYCLAERKHALKVPARPTPRYLRLTFAYLFVMVALCVGIAFGLYFLARAVDLDWFYLMRFVPFAAVLFLCPLVLAFTNLCMKAFEVPHTKKFLRRAAQTLAASPAVKVGITGSFGKTSVKNFAAVLLAQKYNVAATPSSFNTPAGIARTVNEGGADCDIFLAEMGARRTGDIAELCAMVRPSFGVVTGVCAQHTATFGSLEEVRKEKSVLAEQAEKCVLGRSAADMDRGNALVMGRDFDAEEIELSLEGTRFTLRLPDGSVPVAVPVLGRHAAEDIALAAALCSLFGMTKEEIAAGMGGIKPVPHRLERREADGVIILDDAYNCNEAGAKNAVEVLRLAAGRKFAVTPGIVELGQLEAEVNGALGAALAGLDRVILVGETLVLDVRSGYLAAGGEESKLTVVPTLKKAQELLAAELAAGDCVLFLNDLPDIYS